MNPVDTLKRALSGELITNPDEAKEAAVYAAGILIGTTQVQPFDTIAILQLAPPFLEGQEGASKVPARSLEDTLSRYNPQGFYAELRPEAVDSFWGNQLMGPWPAFSHPMHASAHTAPMHYDGKFDLYLVVDREGPSGILRTLPTYSYAAKSATNTKPYLVQTLMPQQVELDSCRSSVPTMFGCLCYCAPLSAGLDDSLQIYVNGIRLQEHPISLVKGPILLVLATALKTNFDPNTFMRYASQYSQIVLDLGKAGPEHLRALRVMD